ncbi:uncharacterized protein [Haliotis cracherodii]|uniref:uncharacterized protein isoform X2 n=1 Tax=Haliotis cracherodii TaxID=6455 RepID=UPI0039EC9968
MEKQYSVQFFASFVEQLQDVCRNYLHFSQFVEVSGYVCVEIDNMKKERYVLSELLQSSGNVVSESYCTKSFQTSRNSGNLSQLNTRTNPPSGRRELVMQRSKENREHRSQSRQYHLSNTRIPHSWAHRNSNHCTSVSSDENDLTEAIDQDDQPWQSPQVWERQIALPVKHQMSKSLKSTPVHKELQNWSTQGSIQSRGLQRSFSSQVRSDFPSGHLTMASQIQDETDHEVSTTLPNDFLENVEQKVKQELESTSSAACEEDDVIDLDLFEDEVGDTVADLPSSREEDTSQDFFQQSAAALPQAFGSLVGTRKACQKGASRGTEHVIKYAVKQFTRYHQEKSGEDIDMLSLHPEALNPLLLDFFQGVRKMDGGLPTASTLKNLQSHLDRYLRDGGYPCSTIKDPTFQSCQMYVKARLEESERCGTPQRYTPVNEEDIELMFQSKQLGAKNSETLLNTMWVLNSKYLGIKRPSEHFNLRWGDIIVSQDEQGQEYLQRKISPNVLFPIRVYARPEDPDRCFVSFFREYSARRPEVAMDTRYFFYLKMNRNSLSGLYRSENMTMHQLGVLWRKLANDSGLPITKKIM